MAKAPELHLPCILTVGLTGAAPTDDILIVLNRRSGKRKSAAVAEHLRQLASHCGRSCDFRIVNRPRDVGATLSQVKSGPHRRVIAAGGDGTMNAVASALVGTRKEFGAIPLGTFNYFAREFGIPLDTEAAFNYCIHAEARPISIGELNGIPFLNNASVGIYPKVLEIREGTYRRFGRSRLAAYFSVLQTLTRFDVNLWAELNMADRPSLHVRSSMIFVGRNATQLQEFRLPGGGCVVDDAFATYVLPAVSRISLIATAVRMLLGKLRLQDDIQMFCPRELQVRLQRKHWTAAIDGERRRVSSPLVFRVRQNSLLAVVPERVAQQQLQTGS